MSRAERLLALLQALRRRRSPVAGDDLAGELEVSLRTLYRDIASLRAQGAAIDGEPGVGYVLRRGFLLPPLMFTADELDALALGAQWANRRGDAGLRDAARDALAKIRAVLPDELADEVDASGLMVGPPADGAREPAPGPHALMRDAIRRQAKLRLRYGDGAGTPSERTVWPLGLGYFDEAEVLVAWCELRDDYRCFRLDRMQEAVPTGARYPGRRRALLRRWQALEGIADDTLLTETGRRRS